MVAIDTPDRSFIASERISSGKRTGSECIVCMIAETLLTRTVPTTAPIMMNLNTAFPNSVRPLGPKMREAPETGETFEALGLIRSKLI